MSEAIGRFRGFPVEAFEFYEGLEADNSKTYWHEHKPRFETSVVLPMQQLLAGLPDRYQPFYIFRPYRDVRFAKDKSPYKTQHAAVSQTDGGAAHYLHVAADGVTLAAGMYQLAPDQLERFRAAVADPDNGAELARVVAEVRRRRVEVNAGHDPPLRRAPRGYSPDHPNIALLRWKACIASTSVTAPSVLESGRLRRRVVDVWERCEPLVGWLEHHVGPTTEPPTAHR